MMTVMGTPEIIWNRVQRKLNDHQVSLNQLMGIYPGHMLKCCVLILVDLSTLLLLSQLNDECQMGALQRGVFVLGYDILVK